MKPAKVLIEKPKKISKPRKPLMPAIKPTATIEINIFATSTPDTKVIPLLKMLEDLPEGVEVDDVGVALVLNDDYDGYKASLRVFGTKEVKNLKYAEAMDVYEKAMKEYERQLKIYEASDDSEYDTRLELWKSLGKYLDYKALKSKVKTETLKKAEAKSKASVLACCKKLDIKAKISELELV